MSNIGKLLERKKALEARIRREQKRAQEKQRERIYLLAAQAGISNLSDEVLTAAFFRVASENIPAITEGGSDE